MGNKIHRLDRDEALGQEAACGPSLAEFFERSEFMETRV